MGVGVGVQVWVWTHAINLMTIRHNRSNRYRFGYLTFFLATYLASPSAILSKV